MTEAEWLVCDNPTPMLEFLRDSASDRKLRLFGVACCRRIWDLMPDVKCELAVDIAESHAEGYCDDEALQAISQKVSSSTGTLSLLGESAEYVAVASERVSSRDGLALTAEAAAVARGVAKASRGHWTDDWAYEKRVEERHQTTLLRDVFGNPFRHLAAEPSWLTSTVVALASQMYQSRDFSAMPILADALQDAGCDDSDILNHCRQENVPHTRGCWVVDLLLRKE